MLLYGKYSDKAVEILKKKKKEKLRSIVKGMCRKLYSTKYVQLVKH